MPEDELKKLNAMKLHEEIEIWRGLDVLKVPGGWIYRSTYEQVGGYWQGSGVFVPDQREAVAMAVLQGLCANSHNTWQNIEWDEFASHAFLAAEAWLAEAEKRREKDGATV